MTVLDRLYDRWPEEADETSSVWNGYERVLLTVQGGSLFLEGIRPMLDCGGPSRRRVSTILSGFGVAAIGGAITAAALTGRVTPAIRSLASASAVSLAVLDAARAGRRGALLKAAGRLALLAALRRATGPRRAPFDPWA